MSAPDLRRISAACIYAAVSSKTATKNKKITESESDDSDNETADAPEADAQALLWTQLTPEAQEEYLAVAGVLGGHTAGSKLASLDREVASASLFSQLGVTYAVEAVTVYFNVAAEFGHI